MKRTVFLFVLALCVSITSASRAASVADRFAYSPNPETYGTSELSLDLFGFYGSRDKGGADREAWGYGAGVDYFLTRNFGLGAETYADAFELPYLVNGMVIARIPLGNSGFAPYGFGGAGRQWDHAAQWLAFVGGGLEFRLNQGTGLFGDIREVFPDKTKDYTMIRFGLRFVLH